MRFRTRNHHISCCCVLLRLESKQPAKRIYYKYSTMDYQQINCLIWSILESDESGLWDESKEKRGKKDSTTIICCIRYMYVLFKRQEETIANRIVSEKGQIVVKYFIAIIAYLSMRLTLRLYERHYWISFVITENILFFSFILCCRRL